MIPLNQFSEAEQREEMALESAVLETPRRAQVSQLFSYVFTRFTCFLPGSKDSRTDEAHLRVHSLSGSLDKSLKHLLRSGQQPGQLTIDKEVLSVQSRCLVSLCIAKHRLMAKKDFGTL